MDKWTVIVEIDGVEVERATYADLGSAQMMQESKRLHYHYHAKALHQVEVWISQS